MPRSPMGPILSTSNPNFNPSASLPSFGRDAWLLAAALLLEPSSFRTWQGVQVGCGTRGCDPPPHLRI